MLAWDQSVIFFVKLKLGWLFLMCCALNCVTHSYHEILLQFLRVIALTYWSCWIIHSNKCWHLRTAFSCTAWCSRAESFGQSSPLQNWPVVLFFPLLYPFLTGYFIHVRDFSFYPGVLFSKELWIFVWVLFSVNSICCLFLIHTLSPAKEGRGKNRQPPLTDSWDMTSFYKI